MSAAVGPRFYLITNDAPRAALQVNCHMGNLPASIAVVDDPFAFTHVPDGAKCISLFWGTRDVVATWGNFWLVRKSRGGIEGISDEEWDRIQAWAHDPKRPSPVIPEPAAEPMAPGSEGAGTSAPACAPPPHGDANPLAPEPYLNQPAQAVKRKARWS